MKNCELCSGGLARMHCESDQAHLCWDCDLKVHGANFLVAKHTRTLLCHVCQNPTPWLASGHHISPAVSVCESCIATTNNTTEMSSEPEESSEEYEDGEYYDDEQDDDEDDDEEEEEEEAENQVVPWSGDSSSSSSLSISKPVPVASSDCVSSSGSDGGFGLKRRRESLVFCSDDEIGCSSSHVGSAELSNGESSSTTSSSRLLKLPRLADEVNNLAGDQDLTETESRSTAIIRSLKRLQKHMTINDDDASATIMGICTLRRDHSR